MIDARSHSPNTWEEREREREREREKEKGGGTILFGKKKSTSIFFLCYKVGKI